VEDGVDLEEEREGGAMEVGSSGEWRKKMGEKGREG